jgi:predicted TIM-barrel fold metal-dependent hydrolase
MIVDVHTHIWDTPQQMGQGTARRLTTVEPYDRLDTSAQAYDAAMTPVTKAIVLGFHSKYLGASISHEQIAAHVKRQPAKYLGFAGIDPMDKDFLGSLNKAQDLGLVGVLISPAAQAFHPSHTRAMRLYEACQERGLPIMIHPGTHLDTATVMQYSQPHLLDEVGRTFPELRLVLAQVGHPWAEQALYLVGKHPHFFADLSDLTQRPWQLYNVLLLAHQQRVTDHLLLGSDFPFCTPERAIKTIYSVNQHAQGTHLPTITREDLRGIVERNALAALGLAGGDEQPDQPEDKHQDADDADAA